MADKPTAAAMRAATVLDPLIDSPISLEEVAKSIDSETGLPELIAACQPVLTEAKERTDYLHDTWDLDAHIELTLTIGEVRAIHAALAKAEGK